MIPIDERINAGYYQKNIRLPDKTKFYDPKKKPFRIFGLYQPQTAGPFKRMPDEAGKGISKNVARLYTNPAGGRIRFETDSEYIALKVSFPYCAARSGITLGALAGFDVYLAEDGKEVYYGSVKPPVDVECGYEGILYMNSRKMKAITLYMPLYNDVCQLEIGLEEGCVLKKYQQEYRNRTPVLYYGSSITQGAGASRCGLTYAAMISRKYNLDFLNLAMSGSALAEDAMIEYMKGLEICCFVCDYDHNAPSAEYLEKTHGKLYRAMRGSHPDIPVILVSAPNQNSLFDEATLSRRRRVVLKTYTEAWDAGDHNVYFVDGAAFFDDDERLCYADEVHPNDIGHLKMAEKIGFLVELALKANKTAEGRKKYGGIPFSSSM